GALGCVLLSTLIYAPAVLAQQASPAPQAEAPLAAQPASPVQPLYATVNGKPITQDEFHAAYANFLRQKFYHGQVPQDQLLQARKDVSDQLVNRILFQAEIERQGIKPDAADVERRLQAYDQRYANSPAWQKNRDTLLPGLREQLNQQSQTTRLEQAVKNLPLPTADEVRAFYTAKPELFTEPEKLRLHSILLGVEPSSPRSVWDAALREAEAIVRRIRAGADFGEQARMFSRDGSAEKGGDLGYLHLGMLPDNLQARIDQFKLGEVADPLEMLQGIGIFRLDERVAAKLQPFDSVAVRAGELLQRERLEKAWTDFLAKIRSEAKIVIYEAFTPPPANQSAVGK
ncbi:MAG: peptidylprolyl isomerase, partial [Sideroxyarcus sp.]|nr:peptidylprolyl isomerase [Sideroxyarcus sp.]